jgi:hypothetical protein
VQITKLQALLAEIAKVPRRQDELKKCSMVFAIDVAFDESQYEGTAYGAKALLGQALNALPGEAVGATEALNVQLAAARPITYDRVAGFYPSA